MRPPLFQVSVQYRSSLKSLPPQEHSSFSVFARNLPLSPGLSRIENIVEKMESFIHPNTAIYEDPVLCATSKSQ
jgi:hypothetical protein